MEYLNGTDPYDPDGDSDDDGFSDKVEIAFGSHPNDATQTPDNLDLSQQVEMTFTIGDWSGSHSERYRIEVSEVDPDTEAETFVYRLSATTYGEVVDGKSNRFSVGKKYKARIFWEGSLNEQPDYDWIMELSANIPMLKPDPENPGQWLTLGANLSNFNAPSGAIGVITDEFKILGKYSETDLEDPNIFEHEGQAVEFELVRVEVDINETAATSDDLVRETTSVDSVSYRDWVKCKLHLDPSFGINTFHLSDPDGKVGFFQKASESDDDPDNDTTPSTSLTLNFDSAGDAFFFITGSSRSTAIDDASIQLRKDNQSGLLLLEKDLTVYYFDEIDLEISHSGNPYTLGQGVATQNAFTYSSRFPETETVDKINYAAEARIRPDGLDCNSDALKNLSIGIAQNVVSTRRVYWTNPTLSSPASVTIATTVKKEWSTGSTWFSDATAITAPLYDKINSDGSSTIDTIDPRCLQVPKGCNPNPVAAQTDDAPGLSDRVFVDIDSGIQGVSVRYELSEVQLIISFRTWTVLYDYDTNEIVPLRQKDWSVNSFSSVNDITWSDPRMDATVGNAPQIDGSHAAPSDLPVTDPPRFNETLSTVWGLDHPFNGTVPIVPHGSDTTTFQE